MKLKSQPVKVWSALAATFALLGSPVLQADTFDFMNSGEEKKAVAKPDDKKPAKQEAPAKGGATKTAATDKCNDPANNIFKTKVMTAAQLMTEMRGLKGNFSSGDPLKSMNTLFGGAPAASKPSAKKTPAPAKAAEECPSLLNGLSMLAAASGGGMFSGIASSVSDAMLDAMISGISYSAIEVFLAQMLDSPDIMSKITVEIPESSSLTPDLRKQTLNLGGFLAAIKGSNLMVESAQKEFDAAKDSYKKVMALRIKAAKTLKEALLAKQELKAALATQQAKGINVISAEDLQYIQTLLDKNPDDFFNDGTVQKIAIAYLKSQPGRKGELVEMDDAKKEFKGHYGAYGRTAAGAASMVGFSAMFIKKTKNLWEKQGVAGGAVLFPMITQGVKEVGALATNVKKVFDASDDMNEGSFLIEKQGVLDKRGISFQKAVGRMDNNSLASFKANLIRDDGSGDISMLYQRAKGGALSLADNVVSKDSKKNLATAYELDNPELFSFENTLADKTKVGVQKKKMIGGIFLTSSKAGKDDNEGTVLSAAQNQLRDNYGKYSNGDARRIMFARGASNKGDWIAAGDYKIRIDNIGMEGLSDQMEFLIAESKHATTRKLK